MTELVGSQSPVPKNTLSIYNPLEFIPLDTTTSVVNSLVSNITTSNTAQSSQLSANETLYSTYFASNPTFQSITPTYSTTIITDTVYTACSFTTVSSRMYVCQLQGVFEAPNAGLMGLNFQLVDATTSTVYYSGFAYANYASSTSYPYTITFNRLFIVAGTGNTMNLKYQCVFNVNSGGSGSIFYPYTSSPAGNFAISTPLLNVFTL